MTRSDIGTRHLRRDYLGGPARSVLILLAAAVAAAPTDVRAQSSSTSTMPARVAFDIPAQGLGSAVIAFAQKAGVRVFFDTAKFGGLRSSAVSGTYTAPEALAALLRGTGLTYRFTAANRVSIVDPAASSNTAAAETAGGIELDAIDVQGAGSAGFESNPNSPLQTDGYVATSSVAATKTKTPLIEVPQSVSTVTRQMLDDRDDQTLTSAVLYTPGVRANTSGFDPRFDSFFIRGLNTTYDGIFRDGLREQNAPFAIFKTEPYGLDGITILKGPSSSLYGGGSPGGVIDLTTKRPTFSPFGEVQTQIGTNNRRQGQFDVGGPADEAGTMAYRFTGLWRKSDTDVPGTPDDKIYLAPAFTWKPNLDTKITFLAEYSKIRTGANLAYYNDFSKKRPVVTDIFSGDPSFNAMKQDQARIGYEFEHSFSPNVTVRQKFRYAHMDIDAQYIDILNIRPGAKYAHRGAGAIVDRVDSVNLDNQVEVKAVTGPITHTLLAGLEARYADYTDKSGYATSKKHPEWVSPIKLDPLTYGGHIWAPNDNQTNMRQKQTELGLYAQDQMKIGPFIAALGIRQDWVNTQSENQLKNKNFEQDNSAFTGRAGLMYLGPAGINPYVAYATSFTPALGSDSISRVFVPMTGELQEAGIKFAPPGINVVATASVFDITEKNVIRADPNHSNRSIQTGELRSRGFEFELTGSLSNGLSLTGGYTYLEPTIVKGDRGTNGNQTSGIPRHAASLWADYVFQPGSALAGFSIGGGARYTGRTFGDDENTFRNRDYLLFDASLKFDLERIDPRLKGVALQVNARNLADTDVRTCEQGYCYRDEGRQVIGSLKYRW